MLPEPKLRETGPREAGPTARRPPSPTGADRVPRKPKGKEIAPWVSPRRHALHAPGRSARTCGAQTRAPTIAAPLSKAVMVRSRLKPAEPRQSPAGTRRRPATREPASPTTASPRPRGPSRGASRASTRTGPSQRRDPQTCGRARQGLLGPSRSRRAESRNPIRPSRPCTGPQSRSRPSRGPRMSSQSLRRRDRPKAPVTGTANAARAAVTEAAIGPRPARPTPIGRVAGGAASAAPAFAVLDLASDGH